MDVTALRIFLPILMVFSFRSWAQETSESKELKDLRAVEKDLEQNLPQDVLKPKTELKKELPKTVYSKVSEEIAQDLAVIQKNYMPKSNRWQASLSFSMLPSDVLYKTFGLSARAAYHFSERWGFELSESYYSSSRSDDLRGLEEMQGVSATNQSSVRNILTGQLYFNQVYGKMALFDRKIVPFEIYNIAGVGVLTDHKGHNTSAFTVGIGDLFSMSRSSALRVELSLSLFEAQSVSGSKSWSNFIFLNVGYSRFFPEPEYR